MIVELRSIKFTAAFGNEDKEASLWETASGGWLLYMDSIKVAEIHYYGLPGWQVFYKTDEIYSSDDTDELLKLLGVPFTLKYPANGYEPPEWRQIKKPR